MRALRALALLSVSLWGCALFSGSVPDYEARPGPYDRLQEVSLEQVAEVRRLRDAGDLATARAFAARLCELDRDNLPLARVLQDLELQRGGESARERLLAQARERAQREPSVPSLLLASRLAEDLETAREDLEAALELEPHSAWVQYSLSHLEARSERWSQAGQHLERALLIDPGHLGARRLQTMLLARSGEGAKAIEMLNRWLELAGESPFFTQRELDEARLDLAQLYLLEGQPARAHRELRDMIDRRADDPRLQALLCAVLQAQGRPHLALASSRRAEELDPLAALPLVQQALLLEEWLGDPDAARDTWRRVLDSARGASDLGAVLLALRARAALERLGPGEQAAAEAPAP